MELCTCAAQHKDPQERALHYYKSSQPQDDIVGKNAFLERYILKQLYYHDLLEQNASCFISFNRQQVYVPVTTALGLLVSKDQSPPLSTSVPLNPGPPAERQEKEQPPDPQREVSVLLCIVL